jgi:hypothetical protein
LAEAESWARDGMAPMIAKIESAITVSGFGRILPFLKCAVKKRNHSTPK